MRTCKWTSLICLVLFSVSCSTWLPKIKTAHEMKTDEETTPTTPGETPTVNKPITKETIPAANIQLTQVELEKYAYELGFDPKKKLTAEQQSLIEKRKKLRILERSLDSQKERFQYSKILPWLKSDEEKIDYLAIPSIEGRQAWINKNKIWSRAKDLKGYVDIMESQDIAIGMPTDYVKKSWGEPDNIEVSGNPIYKNERWKYVKQISTPQGYRQEKRYVYFEGGRVVGWETE